MVLHNTTIPPQQIFLRSNEYTILKNGNMKSNIFFELKNYIKIPNNVDAYLQLNSFKFINAFYNVSTSNNIFYYSLSGSIGTVLSITITPGNYNITTFLNYLNDALGGSIVITYDSTSLKLRLQSSSDFILRTGTNNCLKLMGFNNEDTVLTNDLYSTNLINLSGVQVLYLCIDNISLTSNTSTGSTTNNILESVNVDVLIGSSQSYYNGTNTKYRINPNDLSAIEVKIYDDNGNLVDFNNTDWYMSVSLIFAYKMEFKPTTYLDLNTPSEVPTEEVQANENIN